MRKGVDYIYKYYYIKSIMTKKINSILKEVLERVESSKEELDRIGNSLKQIIDTLKKRIKTLKIDAEVFIGGSFAKNTVIKKDYYDIDIFIRFEKKYKDEVSNLTKKIIKNMKNVSVVHGSRDYFRIKSNPTLYFELIPVIKIKNPKQAENITDLSYSHVKYINKKIKLERLLEDIRIAKAFCYANNCYGAESYINGFSGYALELLIYYYGGFIKFIRAISKNKGDKIFIDIEKHYKNKQYILMNLNSSKLQSPIILIDPTYKQRNALAALSEETFERFKEQCKKFLRNPSINAFEIKKIDLEKIKQNAKKKKHEFILLEAKTGKQEGDIAGSKLLKFYKHLSYEIERLFEIKEKGFNYNEDKSAKYFFVIKKREENLIQGPNSKDKKNSNAFKKKHKNTFERGGRIYAKEEIKFNINEFIEFWKKKNKRMIRDMSITNLRIV